MNRKCSTGDWDVEAFELDADRSDAGLKITRGEEGVTFIPEPALGPGKYYGAVLGVFACDTEATRIFYVHELLGYVVAMTPEGTELWRSEIPGFKPIMEALPGLDRFNLVAIVDALDSSASAVAKALSSGPYVAVEYHKADRFYHAVYHRSGVLIGTVGPWNAVMVGTTKDGWRLEFTNDPRPGAYNFPDRQATLVVGDDTTAKLADHLVAAATPRRIGDQYVWKDCPSAVADMGEVLGERWDPHLAKVALRVRKSLGQEWLAAAVARVHGVTDVRKALLANGVDVEMMRAAVANAPAPKRASP